MLILHIELHKKAIKPSPPRLSRFGAPAEGLTISKRLLYLFFVRSSFILLPFLIDFLICLDWFYGSMDKCYKTNSDTLNFFLAIFTNIYLPYVMTKKEYHTFRFLELICVSFKSTSWEVSFWLVSTFLIRRHRRLPYLFISSVLSSRFSLLHFSAVTCSYIIAMVDSKVIIILCCDKHNPLFLFWGLFKILQHCI